jgi:hypothetical protein
MSEGSTVVRLWISAWPRSRLAPWAWSVSSRSCASRSRLATVTGSAGVFPARADFFSLATVAALVDVGVGEAHLGRSVGVAVELAVQLLGVGVELLGLLAEPQLGDLVRGRAVQVGGEHLAVARSVRRSFSGRPGAPRRVLSFALCWLSRWRELRVVPAIEWIAPSDLRLSLRICVWQAA